MHNGEDKELYNYRFGQLRATVGNAQNVMKTATQVKNQMEAILLEAVSAKYPAEDQAAIRKRLQNFKSALVNLANSIV